MMPRVGATYRDGRIVLDSPVDWGEGTRLVVELLPEDCLIEGVWPDDGSPEGQAEILRRISEAESEPVEFPTEDEAEIRAARAESKRVTLEAMREKLGLKS